MHRLNPPNWPSVLRFVLAVSLAAALPASISSAQETQTTPVDLLAHGAGECFWAARVGPSMLPGKTHRLETIIHARFSAPEDLRYIASINAPVIDLTHRGTQLVVLLRDGQWRSVWPGGSATGLALPPQAKAIALAAQADRLWALASVIDAPPASNPGAQSPATRPTLRLGEDEIPLWARAMRRPASSVPATTAPATQQSEVLPGVEASDAPTSRPARRLVLYRLEPGGEWQAHAELPESLFVDSPQRVSLNVGNVEQPSVAIALDDQQIHVQRLTRDRQWKDLGRISLDEPLVEFDWVSGAPRPTLWVAGAAGPGTLYVKEDRAWRPIELEAADPIAAGAQRAIGMSTDRVRLLYTYHSEIFEQRYEQDGARLGEAVKLPLGAPGMENGAYRWINLAAMAALMLAMFGSVRRRKGMSNEQIMRAAASLAPMGARLSAGTLDALPALVGMFIAGRQDHWFDLSGPPADATIGQLLPLWIGLGVYLLHVTISEMIWGRSLGKRIFGLRVALMDGGRAGVIAIVLRNLLRLAELPIAPVVVIMMLYSPLRQRAGDIAAATIVISDALRNDESSSPSDS